jgi:ABC-type glycerol-3-phosphate transport system substrate-binding protein
MQQGPGLAGFKSVGSNARTKEKVVTKFVKYLLQPKVLNRLAIMSGYIPSTKTALNLFQHYKNGDFNNETGL